LKRNRETAMTTGGADQTRSQFELKPHAYDPLANPEMFEGILPRRVLAFFIDLMIVAVPIACASLFILIFGFFTFGLGWILFWLLSPGSLIWALLYYGFTLGNRASATIGMRVMDLEMRTWYGAPCYFLLGAVHAIVFYLTVTTLTPLILLVGFFNERRRLLHDLLLGTVVINNEKRAAILRLGRRM
jgi:uncharacterized RDD family membrane protein YckC